MRKRGDESRIVRVTSLLFRLLLRFWRRELRERYRDDAIALFRERVRQARRQGRARALLVAARALIDAGREVVRWAPLRSRRKPGVERRGAVRRETMATTREVLVTMLRDTRFALRRLRGNPRFGLLMVLTFGVAVGVTATAHAVAHRLLLAPLPLPDADRLVFVGELDTSNPGSPSVTSRYVLELVERVAPSLSGVASYTIAMGTVSEPGDPATLNGATVTSNYFEVLQTPPALGRGFLPEDSGEGAPNRVVVSHALWRDRLGSDPNAVGRSIGLNARSYEIVGVMGADFESPDEYAFSNHVRGRPSFWIPYRQEVDRSLGRSHRGVARLAPGASLSRARAEVEAVPARVEEEGLDWPDQRRVAVVPLQDHITAGVRPALRLLLVAVGVVLLAGCLNAMGLSFTRGLDRLGELRVKGALGADRGQLLRDLVLESAVLGLVGGALGLVIGWTLLDSLVALAPADIPRLRTVDLEAPTVVLALGVTLASSLGAGLVPGLRLLWGRASVNLARGTQRSGTHRAHRRTLGGFAAVQVATALVLLTGSALLVRSFVGLAHVDLGYEPRNLVVAKLELPASSAPERSVLEDEILRRLSEDASIEVAALATTAPQHGLNDFDLRVSIEGYRGEEPPSPSYRRVTPDFIEAMGARAVRGRGFIRDDVSESDGRRVGPVIVNRAFVRRYLSGRDPLGVEVGYGGWGFESTRIVGVVEDVRFGWPGSEVPPTVFVPMIGEFSTVFLLARARDDVEAVPARVRSVVANTVPGVPVDEVFLSRDLVAASTAETRVTMILLLALAWVTTLLACVGLYGIIAHAIASRRREMAIRMANGATAGRVVRMVVAQGLRPVLVGLALGLIGTMAATGVTRSLLFGVGSSDIASHAAAVLVLTTVGAMASYLPARGVGKLDPSETLRAE